MNILYIAHSCSPDSGSESKIGWNVPLVMSETNKVYVITREESRDSVNSYMQEHPSNNLSFYYVGVPKLYKRLFKGMFFSGQLKIWHRHAYKIAEMICNEECIQIIHQITPIEFRSIGNYARISNIKFVVGPLGGGEYIPKGLIDYARRHMAVELMRRILNYFNKIGLALTHKLDKCGSILYANRETMSYLNEVTCVGGGRYSFT